MSNDSMLFSGAYMWIFWISLFVIILYLLKDVFGKKTGEFKHNNNQSALEILAKRYANGKITDEKFSHQRDLLINK